MILIVSLVLAQSTLAQTTEVSGIVVFNTKYDPYPAEPGKYLDIWFSVRNKADKAMQNIVLKLEPEYPFSVDNAQDAYHTVDYLSISSEALVHFRVRVDVDAVEGVNELKLRHWAGSDAATSTLEKFYIQVVGRRNIEISEITPWLKPGEISNLNFTIANMGRAPLRDITFTWVESDGAILPVGSDNKRYLQVLDVDQKAHFSFKVVTNSDITPGVHSLSMIINYMDVNRTPRNISSSAGILVQGEIELVLTDVSVKNEGFNKFSIKGNIANVGSAEARSVITTIDEGNSSSIKSFEPIGGYFIGAIKADDFSSFELSLTFGSGEAKGDKVEVPLRIQYVNTDNKVIQVFKPLSIETKQGAAGLQEEIFSLPVIIIVGLLIVGVIGVIIYSWKKASSK